MRTAIDTSVLLDVLGADPKFGPQSREALRRAWRAGALTACEVVWAEARAYYADEGAFLAVADTLGIAFDPLSPTAALRAGEMWRAYCRRRTARGRVIADFLVGAHALTQADGLLTRDRGFYRGYFGDLRLFDPAKA